MGSYVSQSTTVNMTTVNNMIQSSQQSCNYTCSSITSNTTVYVTGDNNTITVSSQCTIDGINCIMDSTFDSTLENTMEAMQDQESLQMPGASIGLGGISIGWGVVNQTVNVNQVIENQISQIMTNSCDVHAENTVENTYAYVTGNNNVVAIGGSSTITNSTCNMSNTASLLTFNSQTSDSYQSATFKQPVGMMVIMAIILIIIIAIIAWGATKAGSTVSTGSTTTSPSQQQADAINSVIQQNPELANRTMTFLENNPDIAKAGIELAKVSA